MIPKINLSKPCTVLDQCSQKPLTKVALLVIGLLLAGGAVASHFWGLGMLGIVGFSAGSIVAIALLSVAMTRNSPCKKQNSNEQISSSDAQTTDSEQVKTEKDSSKAEDSSNEASRLTALPQEVIDDVLSHLPPNTLHQMAPLNSVFAESRVLQKSLKEALIISIATMYRSYLTALALCGTNGAGRSVTLTHTTIDQKQINLIFSAGSRSLIRLAGEGLLQNHYKTKKEPENYKYNLIVVIEQGNHKYILARSAKELLPLLDRLAISWFEDMINFDQLSTQLYRDDVENIWPTPEAFTEALKQKMDQENSRPSDAKKG